MSKGAKSNTSPSTLNTEASEWYKKLEAGVEELKTQMGREAQEYYFDRFLRMALRVDKFSADCSECSAFRPQMEQMTLALSSAIPNISKEQKRLFLGQSKEILSHLGKKHKLIADGENIGIWLAIGVGAGVALGAGFGHPEYGIPLGAAIGLAIGAALDAKAKREGKVI